ncbi:hypothetical protein HQ533_01230 [Candidatus Woesearchaeota archaeon]|nr:hypothetical protein [Candidatus Woesearchaeota archaeon]
MKKTALIILLILTACSSIPKEKGRIEVYFCPSDDCEEILIQNILNSKEVKCAFYDLNLENLSYALKNHEVLVFEKNYDGFGTRVKSKGLMHNKFCIFDRTSIVTGSFNPTFNGNFKNNNNLIIIESTTLANNYLEEFEELKKDYNKKTKNTRIFFNNFRIENYFCPEDDCQKKVLEELMKGNESVYFMTFSFTDKEIAKLLVEKSKIIKVEGIMEKKRINMKYNVFKFLNDSGVNVLPDNNPRTMHHKVFIINNRTVIVGSYNPTKSANERNDENILIIHDKNVADKFIEEFYKIRNY